MIESNDEKKYSHMVYGFNNVSLCLYKNVIYPRKNFFHSDKLFAKKAGCDYIGSHKNCKSQNKNSKIRDFDNAKPLLVFPCIFTI